MTEAVFVDASEPPNKTAVLANLTIGSAPPDDFDDGEYTQCATAVCLAVSSEVAIFTRHGTAFDEHTIFRISVNDSARVQHFANVRSTVQLRGAPQFEFRNPPMFMVVHDLAERDAQYETEALIDHLYHHKNVAPFIATRLIQRLTTSNPSPRYVRAVTAAFQSGAYEHTTYSGRYGDLGAAVAAIVLDREATSPILDADPSHGGMREPLIKLFHLMRSMEYTSEDGREIEINTKCERGCGTRTHTRCCDSRCALAAPPPFYSRFFSRLLSLSLSLSLVVGVQRRPIRVRVADRLLLLPARVHAVGRRL